MKILIVGYNVSQKKGCFSHPHFGRFANRFVDYGYDVAFFSNGKYDWLFMPYLKKYKRNKITFYDFVNSPIYGYSIGNIDPKKECSEIVGEEKFSKVLEDFKPDIINIQSLSGLSVRIIEIAKKRGIPTTFIAHDLLILCPRLYGMNYRGETCEIVGVDCNSCATFNKYGLSIITRRLGRRLKDRIKCWIKRVKQKSKLKQNSTSNPIKNDNYFNIRNEFIKNIFNDNIDMIYTVSDNLRKVMIKRGYDPNKITAIYLGFPAVEAKNKIDRHKNKAPFSNPLTFSYFGGGSEGKGIHVLLNSLKYLESKVPIYIKIHGSTDNLDNIYVNNIINSLNENIKVEFFGFVDASRFSEIYKKTDMVIVPSVFFEGGPTRVILEAYSYGVPAIGSNVGGISDLINNKKNGLLFNSGDAFDLADKINLIGKNRHLIADYRKNLPNIESYDSYIKQMEEEFKRILSNYKPM